MEPTYAGLPCIHLSRNGIALLSEKLGRVSSGPESPLKLPQNIVKQLTLKSQVCSMRENLRMPQDMGIRTYVRTYTCARSQ